MNDEALAYRMKRLRVTIGWAMGLLVALFGLASSMLAGIAVATGSPTAGTLHLLAVVCGIAAVVFLLVCQYQTNDGAMRSLFARFDYTSDDPPLDDWRASLKERGALGDRYGGGQ